MKLEEAIKVLQAQLDTKTEKGYYKPMAEEETRVVLNHITKQEKMIQKIHENFCKFDWENSNGEQVHNQFKELYESIFKNEESE